MSDDLELTQNIYEIKGKIFSSPYAWGGDKLIPETLGFTAEPGVPYAEYWLGVHKKAPTNVTIPDGSEKILETVIQQNPERILGQEIAKRFGDLPFLFKLLEAKEMLSIQVHPDKQLAEEGYKRENDLNIPLDDPKRTYKDANQKFEYAIALDTFWLLHGFRQPGDLKNILNTNDEFMTLVPVFGEGGYKRLYTYVMNEMSDTEANVILGAIAKKVLPAYEDGKLQKTSPDYWAAKAIKYMHMDGSYDRGVFSIYFLNLVQLQPGQSIFQNTGMLHAYLEGPIIEVMTTSDNVARGGITPKYIDRDELLKMVQYEGVTPHIVDGEKENSTIAYETSNGVFTIEKILPENGETYTATANSAEILMCMDGSANIQSNGNTFALKKGISYIVFAGTHYEITGDDSLSLFKTSVPNAQK